MKNVLVVASKESQDHNALERAISWSKHFNTEVALIGFTHAEVGELEDLELSNLSRSDLKHAMLEKRQQELKEQIESIDSKAKINIIVQWNKQVAQAVNAYCEKHSFDVVLKSANHSESMLHTPTDWKLMRDCPFPVMITANKSWKKKEAMMIFLDVKTTSIDKIELNHRIIKYACELAKLGGRELHIGYAIKLPQALIDLDIIDRDKYTANLTEKVQPTIKRFCQEYNVAPENVHIKAGPPTKILPSLANKVKAELVIMGASSRKGVSAKLLGNTAEKVLTKLRTDIIVIK